VSELPQRSARTEDTADQRIRRTWRISVALFGTLVVAGLARIVTGGADAIDWIVLALILALGVAATVHGMTVREVSDRRYRDAAAYTRILSGLSRSLSPDAIVDALAGEFGRIANEAAHLVVVRRSRGARVLDAHLLSAGTDGPTSQTTLPLGELEDPGPDGRPATTALIVDRIARRVREQYGLVNTIAAPLVADGRVVGAIVVSRRGAGEWREASRQLLDATAVEASAALARAYLREEAEQAATTDPLTGLPNRRYFDEACELMAHRRRRGDAVGILMIDIDRFKVLNDTYGHATGDAVLRAVGRAVAGAVREDDAPARFGGEEFVVLLRNPDPSRAIEAGERIRRAVSALDLRPHGVPGVTVSVGVAVASEPEQPIEAIIAEADQALYRAKRGGRDQVVAA
jgi:diguanylate cyclase (GGDEF)-like protein